MEPITVETLRRDVLDLLQRKRRGEEDKGGREVRACAEQAECEASEARQTRGDMALLAAEQSHEAAGAMRAAVNSPERLAEWKPVVIRMLRRENELRLSEETQRRYAEAEQSGLHDWMRVTEKLQEQVCREIIPEIDLATALRILRGAQALYPSDAEVLSIPLYVKYNRNRQGDLREGQPAPNVTLHDIRGKAVPLLDAGRCGAASTLAALRGDAHAHAHAHAARRPLLVCAGSYT